MMMARAKAVKAIKNGHLMIRSVTSNIVLPAVLPSKRGEVICVTDEGACSKHISFL